MDCEKFDQLIIDALYEELDELTMAAAKRHTEGCARCLASFSELRATRKLSTLLLVEAPVGLEERVMRAAREAHDNVPWPRRIGRAISWAGNYAMRPQLAMAALLLIMLGSSVLFLRAKPDRSGMPSRVRVTERGVPERIADDIEAPERLPASDSPSLLKAHGARRDEERGRAAEAFAAPPPAQPSPQGAATAAGDPLGSPVAIGGGLAGASKGAVALDGDDKAAPADERPGSLRPRAAMEQAFNGEPSPPPTPAPAGAPAASAAFGGADMSAARGGGVGAFAGASTAPAEAKKADGTGAGGDPYGTAMGLYTAGRYADAAREFDRVAAAGGKSAPSAALYAAKSVEAYGGCATAAAKYESVGVRFSGTSAGAEALWTAAGCYRSVGDFDKARAMYVALRSVAGYRDRAETEIANLPLSAEAQALSRAKPRAAPARPASPPAAAAAPPSPGR